MLYEVITCLKMPAGKLKRNISCRAKCSLVSREVIADSIETVCRGANLDAVICIGGCDKNMPGAMIAIGRMNIPSIFVYGGTIKPGHLGERDLTVVSAFEARITSYNACYTKLLREK